MSDVLKWVPIGKIIDIKDFDFQKQECRIIFRGKTGPEINLRISGKNVSRLEIKPKKT